MSQEQGPKTTSSTSVERATGAVLLGAAVVVFIICCIIQAACGSSMFSSSYADTGLIKGLLINVTFYPGWLLTGALAVGGIKSLVTGK